MIEVLLHTNRLLLKGISPKVIHEVFTTKNEEEIKTFFGVDEKGYQHLKEMHEKGMETHRFSLFFFLIIEKDTNQPIGECGFHTWNSTHRRAELFYFLRDDKHKRKGFVKEALPEVIKYGFEMMGLHRIEALVGKSNIPSIRLVTQHGFYFEGTMREDYVIDGINQDSDCYSLLRHEWMNSAASINI
jgi:ribosomal-protein-alanine N-acetyltransferase